MVDFDQVQAALESLGAAVDAPESHGTLCALLIANADFDTWLRHTLDELPVVADMPDDPLGALGQLFEDTLGQMNHEDMSFELLLPDESNDFDLRLLGLSAWCQGFLYGAGAAGLPANDGFDEQARECLSDLLEISKLSHDQEASDEAEMQLAEIVEHVRVSTMLLNELLNPLQSSNNVH